MHITKREADLFSFPSCCVAQPGVRLLINRRLCGDRSLRRSRGCRSLLHLVQLVARSTAVAHGDRLLRALFGAQTAARARAKHLMRLLERTFDGIELALLGAERASDALVRIDIGFLTALEIRLHRAGRTSVRTSHAAHALLVVDLRHAIFHLNRAKVASLYASLTADAGTVALFLQSNALLRIVAIDLNLASSRAHGQNMLRAGSDALLTRLALFLIDNRDLLDRIDVNRIKRARTLTGSQTQAGIGTRLRSAVDH